MNIAQILERSRRLFPDKPAVIFEGQSITYRELDEMSNRVANGLSGLGIARGDRVALLLPNIPAFMGVYFGIQKIGAIAVCVNSALKAEETRFLLDDSGATALVTTEALRGNVPAENLPQLQHILIADATVIRAAYSVHTSRNTHHATRSELMTNASPVATAIDCAPNASAVIMYTMATGGFPKGAVLSHNNMVFSARTCTYTFRLRPSDCVLLFLPAFYSFAQNAVFLPCFDAGATLVLHRDYGSARILQSIVEHRVTVFFGVPTIYTILFDKASAEQMRSVQFYNSAAAPLPLAIADQWREKFGVVITDHYGMTETSLVSFNHFLKYKPGSIGEPAEGIEMKIVDERGRPVDIGQVGEIVVRGPNVMLGYWNRPAETSRVLKDGWFHTGDLGRMDDDGYFYFAGILKDMVNVSGQKVYAAEVERVLRQHTSVADAAIYGVPDAVMGEQVRASIVSKRGAQVTAEEMTAFCNARMAEFKVPKGFEFVDALPKSETGAVLKRVLREKFEQGSAAGESVARKPALSHESVQNWIVAWLSQKLSLDPAAIETNRPFAEYGLTSILAVILAKDLREWSGRPILPVVAWDYPTVDALTRHLVNGRVPEAPASVILSPSPCHSERSEESRASLRVNSAKNLVRGNETLRSTQGDNLPGQLPADLSALSDDELAKLLAAEIDSARG